MDAQTELFKKPYPSFLSEGQIAKCIGRFKPKTRPIDCDTAVLALISDGHDGNVLAGWWTELNTGKPKKRNVLEMLGLVMSELVEAEFSTTYDDKLPDEMGEIVEVADAGIRLADMAGHAACLGFTKDEFVGYASVLLRTNKYNHYTNMADIRRAWLAVFELVRKEEPCLQEFVMLFVSVIYYGRRIGHMSHAGMGAAEFGRVWAKKVSFNRNRADHKVENRRKVGGKKA